MIQPYRLATAASRWLPFAVTIALAGCGLSAEQQRRLACVDRAKAVTLPAGFRLDGVRDVDSGGPAGATTTVTFATTDGVGRPTTRRAICLFKADPMRVGTFTIVDVN